MTDLTWGILGGLGCGLNWALTSLLVRTLAGRLTPAGIGAIRATLGGSALVLIAVAAGEGRAMLAAPLWVVLSLWTAIVLAMVFGDTLFFHSMEHLGVTRALTLGLANPLLTTCAGILLYGEAMTVFRLLGIGLVIGGLVTIIGGRGRDGAASPRMNRQGLRLVFLAAAAWAVSTTIVKPALLAVPVLTGTALRIPFAGLVLWLTPWTRGTIAALRTTTARERLHLALLVLLNVIGSALFTVAIRFGGVAVGNALANTSPLFAIPLEVWILGQRPRRETVVGATITVVGIACLNM
jgi:drug/metabolite transporter (DMT)-like permease